MAATKKGTTGTKAGAGAGKSKTQAKGVAKSTKAAPAAKPAAAKKAASKAAAPAKKAAAGKQAATVKKTATVKLNDRQREILGRIKGAGESGYEAPKAEQRTIDALAERKLVKKGAKNKQTGKAPYLVTKAGEKHLPAAPSSPAAAPSTPPAAPPASPEQAASV
jgi:hypothetical protein